MAKASKKNNDEVLELEAEEIPVAKELQKSINQEIKRFDPFEKRLNEMKEKYSVLTIVDINDRDGYEDVRTAIGELRSVRTGTAKDKAIIKKPFLEACAAIEEKSKWIISEVEKIETPLQNRKDEIDAEKEKIKQERLAKEAERLKVRTAALIKMGVVFDGVGYTLGDVSFDLDVIRESEDDLYERKIFPRYKEVFDKNEEIRLDNERKQQEILAEEQRKKDELIKREEQIRAHEEKIRQQQQAEIEKENAEKIRLHKIEEEKRNAEITERCGQLTLLGLKFDFNDNYYKGFDCAVHTLDISGYDKQKWAEMIQKMIPHIEKVKKEIQDNELKEQERKAEELRLKTIEEEKQRAERQRLADEEQKRLDEIKRQEQIDKSADTEQWAEFLKNLNALKVPTTMKSGHYRAKARAAKEAIEGLNEL
jgi:hypothetical protein